MVSSKIISNFPKSDKRITSLCDWIGRIKNKKRDVRRNTRFNQSLRVVAVLSRALDRAENEMRVKQRERAQKWAEFTADVNIHIEQNLYEEEAKQEQHRKNIEELWNVPNEKSESAFRSSGLASKAVVQHKKKLY